MQQADRAHSATGTIASPGNLDVHTASHFGIEKADAPSRRSLLALAAGVGAVALTAAIAPCPARAAPVASDLSVAWERAMAAYQSAKAAYDDYDDFYDRACIAWRADEPDEATVDWSALHAVSTSHPRTIDTAAEIVRLKRHISAGHWRNHETISNARMIALHQLQAWQIAREANERRHDFNAKTDRFDSLSMKLQESQLALLQTPAPDMMALLWKLEFLLEDDDGSLAAWSMSWVNQTLVDARRLAA